MKERYAILLVPSISHATRAEAVLKSQGLRCKLIPVPREVSSDCGVCVRVARSDCARAVHLLAQAGVTITSRHDI
ncbi:MAG: DUF3343 domain-containing protein [Calditrichaeota bacterium]|nr:DUF3343 domain-containing protein [Calditrichota bacterium]